MTTFAGKEYNLKFLCTHCKEEEALEVNPESSEDMMKLGNWLLQHSASGGTYENVKIEKPKVTCFLCKEVIEAGHEVVNYTGKPICMGCAKDITLKMLDI